MMKTKNFFWSGDCLMQDNNDGTFSSSHILEVGKIQPTEEQKQFIISALNSFDTLVETLLKSHKLLLTNTDIEWWKTNKNDVADIHETLHKIITIKHL